MEGFMQVEEIIIVILHFVPFLKLYNLYLDKKWDRLRKMMISTKILSISDILVNFPVSIYAVINHENILMDQIKRGKAFLAQYTYCGRQELKYPTPNEVGYFSDDVTCEILENTINYIVVRVNDSKTFLLEEKINSLKKALPECSLIATPKIDLLQCRLAPTTYSNLRYKGIKHAFQSNDLVINPIYGMPIPFSVINNPSEIRTFINYLISMIKL